VITKLDRRGRSVRHLIDVVSGLGERDLDLDLDLDLEILARGIDTMPTGRLLFHIIGAIAEFVGDESRRTHATGSTPPAPAAALAGAAPSSTTVRSLVGAWPPADPGAAFLVLLDLTIAVTDTLRSLQPIPGSPHIRRLRDASVDVGTNVLSDVLVKPAATPIS
jgi:hypothetical protein